jgi:signal peptidase I
VSEHPAQHPTRHPVGRRLTSWPLLLAVAVAAIAGGWWLRGNVLGSYRVESGSMEPTLCAGDQVLVDKRVEGQEVERNDLVVVTPPGDPRLVVKRVVGVPGDRLAIRDALLFVNGRRVNEPYVDHDSIDALFYGPLVVPDEEIYVMGDNRAESIDSRDYDGVPFDRVQGRVLLTWWSGCE